MASMGIETVVAGTQYSLAYSYIAASFLLPTFHFEGTICIMSLLGPCVWAHGCCCNTIGWFEFISGTFKEYHFLLLWPWLWWQRSCSCYAWNGQRWRSIEEGQEEKKQGWTYLVEHGCMWGTWKMRTRSIGEQQRSGKMIWWRLVSCDRNWSVMVKGGSNALGGTISINGFPCPGPWW